MEPLSIIAIIVACLVGWVIVSAAAALIFGRAIGRADEERRAGRVWRERRARQRALTRSGVSPDRSPPERASMR